MVRPAGGGIVTRPGQAGPENRFAIDVDGVRIVGEARGTGPAILFVHGFPLDRRLWRHQMDHLEGWRRIAVDLRGMGASSAPVTGYTMASYASDLVRVLDVLEVESAAICGLSMGGYVAFEFMRSHGARATHLILMDTKAAADDSAGRQARNDLAQAVRERGSEPVVEAMLPRLLSEGTVRERPDVVAMVRDMIVGTSLAGLVGALEAMRDRPDSVEDLEGLDLPVLVMVGAEDRLTPPQLSQTLAGQVPGARLALIAGAGHLPPMEQPNATTSALRRFLEGG